MKRALIPLVLLLITATIFISGCETKTANQTWGEKKINLTLIEVSKNTTSGHEEYDGVKYFYVEGWLINKNPFDALEVKLKGTFFDNKGNIILVNDTPELETNNIVSNGKSYFLFEIEDPNNQIVNYTLEVIDAKSTYGT